LETIAVFANDAEVALVAKLENEVEIAVVANEAEIAFDAVIAKLAVDAIDEEAIPVNCAPSPLNDPVNDPVPGIG
jgi:hypothetical protein